MNNSDNETRWFWMCSKCGLDTPYIVSKYVNRKGYDEYWSKADETQAYMELDDFFYNRHIEYK